MAGSGGRDIEAAVVVDAAMTTALGFVRDAIRCRQLECAVAVPEEHGDVARAVVGNRKIERAIAVEIAYAQSPRLGTGRIRSSRAEAVVSGLQQHGKVV